MHGRAQRAVLGTTCASVGVSPGTCWALRVPSAPVTGCVHTLPVPAHGFGDPLGAFSSLSAPRAPDATRDLIRVRQWHEPPTPPVSAGDMGQCPCKELPGRREWVTSAANRPDGDTRWDASAEVTTESSGSGTAGAGAVFHPLHGRGCFDPGPPRGDGTGMGTRDGGGSSRHGRSGRWAGAGGAEAPGAGLRNEPRVPAGRGELLAVKCAQALNKKHFILFSNCIISA